jgi:hypothetical protein
LIKTKQLEWVRASKYYELSGETKDSVTYKRTSGKWVEGVHWRIAPDGMVWVNLVEVEKWVTGNQVATLKAVRQRKQKPLAA